MLDIIFISYDEPNADKNFKALQDRFPHVRRVHGVKGIAAAHIAANKKARTRFFYVVDADAEIRDDFDFSFKPGPGDEDYVHIWHAFNPAIGLDYGYGGVKLFCRDFFSDVKTQLDFSTTLAKGIKLHESVACTTRFNSDAFRAFRGAFRESVKLYKTANDANKPERIRVEAQARLNAWLKPLRGCDFRTYVRSGALLGVQEAQVRDDLMFINDHDLTIRLLKETYPQIDLAVDPVPPVGHPMKPELFFTTRIASVMYDPFVEQNLPLSELRDALSDGQMLSKLWLVEVVKSQIAKGEIAENSRAVILGGWIGTLSLMFHAHDVPLQITSVDIDDRSNVIAQKVNYDYTFVTRTMDMYDVDYRDYDVIINTSSEHIPDIETWRSLIPDGKVIVVQNNNFLQGSGHVSCVSNSDELRRRLLLSDVMYEGTRKFAAYDRYMLIGRT